VTGLHLTPEAVEARRLELATVEEQIRALGRRKSVLRAEILSGYAAPVKGKPAEQLPLVETATATTPATQPPEAPAQAPEAAKPATATTTATPLRDRVRAALGAAKVRRSAKVLALLLGESEEDVAYELEGLELAREVIGKNTSGKASRAYELRNRWEAKRGTGRDTKPGKGRKKGKKEPATPPPAEIAVLGDMTMAEVRQALLDEIGTWKRWHSGAAADQALWAKLRESGHDDEDGFDLIRRVDHVAHEALTALAKEGRIQCSEGPGNWNNSYAPLGVDRADEGGPDEPRPPRAKKASKKPAGKAPAKKAKAAKGKKAEGTRSRTWTVAEDIEAALREWGTWFEVGQLEAKVREALPLSLGPSTAEWNNALRGLIEVKKIQRREVDGQVQFRLAVAPEPKKKGKKTPEAPRPTVTVGEAMSKMLAEVSVHDWQQARAEVCEKIAQRKGEPVSVGSLLLKVGCDSNLVTPVLELLEEAGAVSLGYKGKSPSVVSLSATVSDEEIAHDLQALTRRYVRGLVEDWGGDPTTADLAGNLDQPPALVDSVLIELRAAQELLCDREGRWSVRSPKASAAARTAPLFADVEPAPAVDGLEPEGDET
jgi:hypothetical protein